MTFVIFYEDLEFVAETPLEIVATLLTIVKICRNVHVDIEQVFERRGDYE